MDAEHVTTTQSEANLPGKRRWPIVLKIITFGSALLLVALVLLFIRNGLTDGNVTWITPQQLADITRQGPFTRFKWKLRNATAPLWQPFRRAQPVVEIRSRLIVMPSDATFDLGSPATTNRAGLRAWTLSATQFETMQQKIKNLPPERTVSAPRISNVSGSWASISVGNTVLVNGARKLSGIEINVKARAVKTSWDLTCGITATEPLNSPPGKIPEQRTNLTTACRAMIPNAGALVIQQPGSMASNTTNYWIILSPTTVVPTPRGKSQSRS